MIEISYKKEISSFMATIIVIVVVMGLVLYYVIKPHLTLLRIYHFIQIIRNKTQMQMRNST